MAQLLPIVITILQSGKDFVFIERTKEPYQGLWSLVGGKMQVGEHIHEAAIREIFEETGSNEVLNYQYRGLVSERLVDEENRLMTHFLIFVGKADVFDFKPEHREGRLATFTKSVIEEKRDEFLPSDWCMFKSFGQETMVGGVYEAEMQYIDNSYKLIYYRKVRD